MKEKSVLRNILKTCQKVSGDVYEQQPVSEILERIEKRIFDLTQVNLSDSMLHIKDILNSRVEDYMEIVDNPEKLDEDWRVVRRGRRNPAGSNFLMDQPFLCLTIFSNLLA